MSREKLLIFIKILLRFRIKHYGLTIRQKYTDWSDRHSHRKAANNVALGQLKSLRDQ
jgi:hypothetical protein